MSGLVIHYHIKRKMNKEEYIKRHGELAYEKRQQRNRDWAAEHRREENTRNKKWCKLNPDKIIKKIQKVSCKGGKYYEHHLEYNRTGLRGERNRIRTKHGIRYRPFKKIIAPDSQIHHEWIPGTSKYRGMALVEENPHRHGIIKVIQILEGRITLL